MIAIRLTRTLPLTGEPIGLTLWWGTLERGWTGKPVAPWRWGMTWRVGAA